MNHDYQKTVFKKYIVYSQKFPFKLNNAFDNILSDLCLVEVHLTDRTAHPEKQHRNVAATSHSAAWSTMFNLHLFPLQVHC